MAAEIIDLESARLNEEVIDDTQATLTATTAAALSILLRKKVAFNKQKSYQNRFGEVDSFDLKCRFMIALSRDLSLYGSPTHRLEYLLERIGTCIGLECSFFVLPGMLMINLKCKAHEYNDYRKIRTGMHLGKLSRLNSLCYTLLKGTINIHAAAKSMDDIRNGSSLSVYANLWIFPAFSFLICAAGFGGSWTDSVMSGLIGMVVGVIQVLAGLYPDVVSQVNEFFSAFASAALIALLANFLNSYGIAIDPQKILFSAIAILLPGLSLTLSILDISTKNLVCGVVRLFSALFTALLLGFGSSFASILIPLKVVTNAAAISNPVAWQWYFILLPLLSILICILFEAKPNQWPIMVMVSTSAIVGQIMLSKADGFKDSTEATITCISFMIGFVSNIYSRITGEIAIAPVFAGIIMIVPGSYGVKSTLGFIQNQTELGLAVSFKMLVIAVCITVGIFLATFMVWPINETKKRTLISF